MYESDSELIRFFKSRKSKNTRNYTIIILQYLSRPENKGKRLRLKEIKNALISPDKIKDTTSFHRVMNDLSDYGIVEKMTDDSWGMGGRNPVYFRFTKDFNPVSFLPREELEKIAKEKSIGATIDLSSESSVSGHMTTKRERECEQELKIAKEILKEYGLNPDEEIEKRIKSLVPS